MTSFWQEQRGSKRYRLQTGEFDIFQKVKRRQGFRLISESIVGKKVWIFVGEFSRPDIALKTFKSIMKCNIRKIDSEDVYVPDDRLDELDLFGGV